MYYSTKLSPVEREHLRERDREARAQIMFEAEQRGSQDVVTSGPIFGEIVQVHPESDDFERQQIERKLGRFEDVKHLLDHDNNLFGIDGQPPPSPAPPNISKAASALSSHEFKKPNSFLQSQPNRTSHHHSHHGSHRSSSQRGGLYTSQPMKNGSSTTNDFRNSSNMVSLRGISPLNSCTVSNSASHHSSSSTRSASQEFSSTIISNSNSNNSSSNNGSSGSKVHQAMRNLPKLHCEIRDIPLLQCCPSGSGSGSSSQANVENILDEMTLGFRTPLTAIAATPRKEMESKFTFSAVSGKMESLSPVKTPMEKNCYAYLYKEYEHCNDEDENSGSDDIKLPLSRQNLNYD